MSTPNNYPSVGALRAVLAYVSSDTRVNVTLKPHGDVAQDFAVTGIGHDRAVGIIDLLVDMPEGVTLVHGGLPSFDKDTYARQLALVTNELYAAAQDCHPEVSDAIDNLRDLTAHFVANVGSISTTDFIALANTKPTPAPANDLGRLAAELQALRKQGVLGPLADDVVIDGVSYLVTITTEVEDVEPAPAAPKRVWSCGWNIPGYLPDDEPMNFDTWKDAAVALSEALYQAAEDRAEQALDQALDYDTARHDLEAVAPEHNWSYRIGNYVWWLQNIVLPDYDKA